MKELKKLKEEMFLLLSSPKIGTGGKLEGNWRKTGGKQIVLKISRRNETKMEERRRMY